MDEAPEWNINEKRTGHFTHGAGGALGQVSGALPGAVRAVGCGELVRAAGC